MANNQIPLGHRNASPNYRAFVFLVSSLAILLALGAFLIARDKLSDDRRSAAFLQVVNEDSASIQTLMATESAEHVTYAEVIDACGKDIQSRTQREQLLRQMDLGELREAQGQLVELLESENRLVRAVRLVGQDQVALLRLARAYDTSLSPTDDIFGFYAERNRQNAMQRRQANADLLFAKREALTALNSVVRGEQNLNRSLSRAGLGFAPASLQYEAPLRAEFQ